MDTGSNAVFTIPLATPEGKKIFIPPSSELIRSVLSTVYTLGLAIAVAVLFVLWLTGKLIILVAALLVMAFDIPAPATQMAVTKITVSEPSASPPTVETVNYQGLIADPW